MHRWTRSVITLLLVALARSANAQAATPAQPPPDALARANALFAQGDWAHALTEYTTISNQYPRHALSRFRVGVALVGLGKYVDGEASIRAGERLGVAAGPAAFRLAESLAEQGKIDAATAELERSAAAGYAVTPSQLDADTHLAAVRATAKWPMLLDAFDAVVQPCKHDARFREFDFWVGDWDVRPTGTPAVGPPARNTVTIEDNGCVVMEHWVAPGGSQGQSFNIFDRSVGQWRQTWVDNGGGQHDYRGAIKDGNMVFVGDTPAPGGKLGRIPTRLTFFKFGADSVRQFSESSGDGGKTWTSAYDLMYVRRPAADTAGKMSVLRLGEVTWVQSSAGGLATAVVEGDPRRPDEPYSILLKLPNGFWIQPHWHPRDTRVVVLQGSLLMSMGDSIGSQSATIAPVGSVLFVPAKAHHAEGGGGSGETIVLLYGTGPLITNFVRGH